MKHMWERTQLHVLKKIKITDKRQALQYCHSCQREWEPEDERQPENGFWRGEGGSKDTWLEEHQQQVALVQKSVQT